MTTQKILYNRTFNIEDDAGYQPDLSNSGRPVPQQASAFEKTFPFLKPVYALEHRQHKENKH